MAAPGGLTPLFDVVNVNYELVNRNTLQTITHSGSYAEVNNNQFVFLKVRPELTSFDKRVNKVLLTFKQYTSYDYQVYLNIAIANHLINNEQIPLRKYTLNGLICYEADITELVAANPTSEIYFAITASSSMSFYVKGTNKPSASIVSYLTKTGNYSPYIFNRSKSYHLRNYSLNVDLFSLVPVHIFNLFEYSDELMSFNLSLVNSFINKNTSNITSSISTGLPKGFKFNIQQYLYSSGTREYTYIDENYYSHVFKGFTNDNGTFTHFVDSNGSYLILEVINSGYKIYSLDGNVKTFSSSGFLINETIKNGSNTSTISYSYSNNLLTGVSINNQSFVSIVYSSSLITISLLDNSSITLNLDNENRLVSLVDQENVIYQLDYDSDIAGLLESVSVTNNKKISLSYNDNLMLQTISLFTYNPSSSNYVWDVNYDFSCNAFQTSYFDDDGLVYAYKFSGDGQIIQSICYKNSYNNVLMASCVEETVGHSFFLSTNCSNYLKEITYNSNTFFHFENSISLSNNNQQANFLLKPKEKGQYFLYFEYLRNFINNYQSLSSLSVSIFVTDSLSNTYQIVSNIMLNIDGFDKVNTFMKEIIIQKEYYNQNLSLSFSLSNGDSTVTIRNIRLYRIEESNNEYYGLNSYTGGSDLNLLNDDTNPTHFYELTSSIPFEVNNLAYSVDSNYQDIKATLMSNFFLNKGMLFYNKGKNAYFGSITKSSQSLGTVQLVKVNYQNKRLSNDDKPYDGYKAMINSYDTNALCFVEKSVTYNYQFMTYSTNSKFVNQNYLLVNQISSIPYGETDDSDPEHENYKYHKYNQAISFTYNSNGQLVKKSLSTNASNHTNPYFEKCSEVNSYSSNSKHLTGVNQQLFDENNDQINNIVSSYEYSSLGDISKTTDAYNKETSYSYNRFHCLATLISYNSGFYHNNNIVYDALLNPSLVSNFNNQNPATYSYDYKGRVSSITYGSLLFNYSYQQTQEGVTYSDGNNSYSFSVSYSDIHLPTQVFSGVHSILVYHYKNKYTGLSSLGNNSGDRLESIFDYKGINDIKVKVFSYDDYGNLSSISENGYHLEIASSYSIFGNDDYGHTSGSPFIQTASTYRQGLNVIKEEKSYQFISDPFTSYKEINEPIHPNRNIIIEQGIKAEESNSPFIKVSLWYAVNEKTTSIESSFDYYQDENGKQTAFIKEQNIKIQFLNQTSNRSITYSYNNNGSLTGILSTIFAQNSSYSYNDFNELSSETSAGFGTINYQYDNKGNITTIYKFNSSTVYAFAYDNNNRLTSFTKTVGLNNPETFSCSGYSFGRPTTYKNKTLVWDKNELAQYDNVSFSYDGYGRRISKSSTNRSVEYKYIDNTLLEETVTEIINNETRVDTLRFIYDLNNNIIGFETNDNVYIYVKDALNNVIAIYNQSCEEMCRYQYDAYGNCIITASITGGDLLGELNPIRYRSYYFDKETGLYYLKSRYYDPEICRFISMDNISYLDPQSLNGLNLYAYCCNDPINKTDPNGHFWISLIVGTILGAFVGFTAAVYSDYNADGIWFNGKWQDYVFEIGLGAITGAIGGGVGSFFSTSNYIAGFVLSTTLGTGSQIISDYYYGDLDKNSKWYDVLLSGIKGGAVAGFSYTLSFVATRFMASKEFTRIVGESTSNHHINQALVKAGLSGKIGQVGKNGIIRELMNTRGFGNFNTMLSWLFDMLFVGLLQ